MNTSGAVKLQKIIKALQANGVTKNIVLRGPTDNILWIEKRTRESESRTEFAFQIRIERVAGKDIWWPISYNSVSGEAISCETVANGRTLTNFVKQDVLIELAESWAKTLEAELVAKTVGNALR
ncbi:MAG: hypothetical protein JST04_12845 [Bdellovibrionales bacterium]|nr:hypothetical protein [Bdellovibrionales bacterium]